MCTLKKSKSCPAVYSCSYFTLQTIAFTRNFVASKKALFKMSRIFPRVPFFPFVPLVGWNNGDIFVVVGTEKNVELAAMGTFEGFCVCKRGTGGWELTTAGEVMER